MEWLQNLWNEYGAVIMTFVGSGFGATVMGFISTFTAKLAANKVMRSFDENRIVAAVSERVVEKVCKSLTGNVIDVDISALVSDKLNGILGEVTAQVREVRSSLNSMKECSALTAKAIGKSKLLDRAEQEALAQEAEKLSANAAREEKPVTKVALAAKSEPEEAPAQSDLLKL